MYDCSVIRTLVLFFILLPFNSAYLSSSFHLGYSLRNPNHQIKWNKSKELLNRNVLRLSSESNEADEYESITAELSIEYCTGCRWLLRSAWLMQELFMTFDNEMTSITLIPSKPPSPGGTFEIKLNEETIWDRKIDKGFPEAKVLKQRVRDKISPQKNLGHSDNKLNELNNYEGNQGKNDCIECEEKISSNSNVIGATAETLKVKQLDDDYNVKIIYCTGCRWMLRSAWMCQELLSSFETELYSVTLIPGYDAPGTFKIYINNEQVWDRKVDGGFPDVKVLKQRVRDIVNPDRGLGHIDDDSDSSGMSDDDAEELRRFYGVM